MPIIRDVQHYFAKAEAALHAKRGEIEAEIAAGRLALDSEVDALLLHQVGAIEWACHQVGAKPEPEPVKDETPPPTELFPGI